MKKLMLGALLLLSVISCKKETKDVTPPAPLGPCHCGEVLQTNINDGTVTAKNYCTGHILTFYVGAIGLININSNEPYCRNVQW